jgi:hypothetical protein
MCFLVLLYPSAAAKADKFTAGTARLKPCPVKAAGRMSGNATLLVLFISQRPCRINSRYSKSWEAGSNERYQGQGQDHGHNRWHVVDSYAE